MYGVIPIRFIGRAIFNIVMERKRWGVDLFTAPPKSITSAFVCDISRVCCHCHMASQGSLDWFRTETVITDCNCSLSAVPTRALVLILSRTLPVTEVRLKQLSRVMGEIRQNRSAWFSHACYWGKDVLLRFLGVLLLSLLNLFVILFSCVYEF